ncbi:hypothetical protein D3C86_1706050 [compost metagenome]
MGEEGPGAHAENPGGVDAAFAKAVMEHPGPLEAVAFERDPGTNGLEGAGLAHGFSQIVGAREASAPTRGLHERRQVLTLEGGRGGQGVSQGRKGRQGRGVAGQADVADGSRQWCPPKPVGAGGQPCRHEIIDNDRRAADAAAVADGLQQG